MKALKFLARGKKLKLKDLKFEKKILSKLFSDNSNVQSFLRTILICNYF